MVRYEDDCVGCNEQGLPCRSSSCVLRNVKHLYCDRCKSDVDKLYLYDDMEVCEDCLLEIVPFITEED